MPEQPTGPEPFDAQEKRNLAESTVRSLWERPCGPLDSVPVLEGSGVYAL